MKRKFSLFLNVAVLALCVCAIAIGVYSAKTASLNVGGTVGFVAHNCKVELSGSIQACATSEDTVRTTKQISARTIGESESSYSLNLDTVFGSAMQFSDMFDDGQTIIITLNIKNTSAFAITAKANMPTITGSNISKTVKLGTSTITQSTSTDLEINGTTTLTITLTLNSTVSSFATNALVSGTLFEFEKYIEVEDSLKGTWLFNDTITSVTSAVFDINFNYYYRDGNSIIQCVRILYKKVFMSYLYYECTDSSSIQVCQQYEIDGNMTSYTWLDEKYQTIIITSTLADVENGDVLLSFLQENATKQ